LCSAHLGLPSFPTRRSSDLVGEDFFLSLLLLGAAGTLLYAVGLFALPLVVVSLVLTAPVLAVLRRWGVVALPHTVVSDPRPAWRDRKSTRLNSSHVAISYAV